MALWKKLHFMTPCKLQRDKEEYSLIMLSNPIEDALLDKGAHTTKNLKGAKLFISSMKSHIDTNFSTFA